MKKIKYTFLASALVAFSLAGCNDLDTEPLGSTITTDQKEEAVAANPDRVEASVTAISSMFSQYGNILGENQHNDFGYPTIMLWTDTRGMDLVSEVTGYNWFSSAVDYADIQHTSAGPRLIWGTLYKQINSTNAVTAVIDPETDDETLLFYLANAYAVRAFDYFTLAQLFQKTYVGNEDKPCVPLITEENMDAVAANGCERATVKDVYAQIMSDLDNAIDMLSRTSITRADKRYVSLEVAYGLRARVNLVMNNWVEAANDAQMAMQGDAVPYSMEDVDHPGFSDIEDAAWMWGILVSETDRVVTTGICNFPSHMGSLNYGYASVGAWRCVNQLLFDAIPSTDVRKGWWLDADCYSPNLTQAQQNYAYNQGCYPYTQMKFGCYQDVLGQSTNCNDIPLMRIEEMYLILAEAQVMTGDVTAAANTLQDFVRTYRDPQYTCNSAEAEEVRNAVWQQRRIELWGEGFSYFDILRMNKNVDRRGAGFAPEVTFNIPAGDDALIFCLPEKEIQSNPALTDTDNNPTPTRPQPVAE